jgi:catechol 2,3-dioxygenase-like lactoylglutathione lyase family enzyme
VEGPSIYGDYLKQCGEGLHHLNFLVDDVDETAEILAKEGFPSLQSGKWGPPAQKGGYNYIEIKPLRTIWEPVRMADMNVDPIVIPGANEPSPAKFKVKGINQIAIVVKDLEMVAQNYWNILGIGPWTIIDWESPLVYDRKYYGKPAWARERIALAQVGNVQLELVQAVEGPSIYGDYVKEYGEGLHHLNFLVDDVDETAEILAREGFPSLQSGKWGPPEQKGGYNYIEIKPLRTIWEPVRMADMEVKTISVP